MSIKTKFTNLRQGFVAFVQRYPVATVAFYIATVGNHALWREFFNVQHETAIRLYSFAAGFYVLIILSTSLILQLINFRYLLKPLLAFVLIVSAASAYFMSRYGAYMDTTMMHNVLETDLNETMDLLSSGFLIYVLFFGVLPAIFVLRLKIQYQALHRQLLRNSLVVGLCSLAVVANVLVFYGDYASLFRNHHHVRYLINPVSYLFNMGAVVAQNLTNASRPTVAVGLDARQVKDATTKSKRSVIVLVVGETARAMNFSLNGYEKNTNPLLSKEDIINYPHAHSCGTSTHTSLPCMFLHFKRSDYSEADAPYYEKLPDVLKHAGLEVLWRDNNSGCKGVCNNIKTENMYNLKLPGVCNDRECYDEVLLDHLTDVIESGTDDIVIILHQKGSHGPAYYLRHPDSFKKFTPECHSSELSDCRQTEVVNAYDNTILYTDYFLTKVISILKKESAKYDTAMLYMSDHGESLGENNIYLHSLPYFFAPREQKQVPFVTWFSDGFLRDHHIDKACLRQHAAEEVSHDNLFHSLLGLTNVTTSIYDERLDIYHKCRTTVSAVLHKGQQKG